MWRILWGLSQCSYIEKFFTIYAIILLPNESKRFTGWVRNSLSKFIPPPVMKITL